MDQSTFAENFIEASMIEDGFVFLDHSGRLPVPKKTSSTSKVGITAGLVALTVAANVLVGGNVRVFTPRPFVPGSHDHDALVRDLMPLKQISRAVGIRIRYGCVVVRLIVDADASPTEDIVSFFGSLYEYTFRFCHYSEHYAGSPHAMMITQGAITFSHHRQAKEFAEHAAARCIHCPSSFRATQPWIIDLEDETVLRCVSIWQLGRTYPLNSKKMLPRLFQKRVIVTR